MTNLSIVHFVVALLAFIYPGNVLAFSVSPGTRHRPALWSSTTATSESETTEQGLFQRERYIATNRFAVRKNQQAKFEQRWATRKSRLAQFEGFQHFHLMRRVTLNDDDDGSTTYWGGDSDEEAFENYVSFTIWNKKSHFSAWRSGEAFKEAHGGTSIGAFLSTLVRSALVLRGAPKPAFYDGFFLQKGTPQFRPEMENGWRKNVPADGVQTLAPECFVVYEKFFIFREHCPEFEQFWATRHLRNNNNNNNNNKDDVTGLLARVVMRRDAKAKGHGMVEMQENEPTYVIASIFSDLASFQAWAASSGRVQLEEFPASFSAKRAPETVYYEGTLCITSPEGA